MESELLSSRTMGKVIFSENVEIPAKRRSFKDKARDFSTNEHPLKLFKLFIFL